MPKKTAKKSIARKVASKPTKASKSTTMTSSSSMSLSSLRAQQNEFHQKHTNANNLIGLFIFSFCVLVVAYLYFGGMLY